MKTKVQQQQKIKLQAITSRPKDTKSAKGMFCNAFFFHLAFFYCAIFIRLHGGLGGEKTV